MTRTILLACLIAVNLSSIAVCQSPAALFNKSNRSQPDLRCGAYCLYTALKALDFPVTSFEELERRLGAATPLGYSFNHLQLAAESYRAQTLALSTNLEELRRLPRPFACIARMTTGHFVIVGDVSDKDVWTINAPDSVVIPRETFESLWDGNVLLVSHEKLTADERISRPAVAWAAAGLASAIAIAWIAARRLFSRRAALNS